MMSDPTARQRCFGENKRDPADLTPRTPTSGPWRLVRTPDPRGGPDAVAVMQTADPSQSDLALAGVMLRCSGASFRVLIVVLEPVPPRAHPKVKLATGGTTAEFNATVLPSGAALELPDSAAQFLYGPARRATELAIEVFAGDTMIRGTITLAGLETALALLTSNCPVQ